MRKYAVRIKYAGGLDYEDCVSRTSVQEVWDWMIRQHLLDPTFVGDGEVREIIISEIL